MSLIIGSSVNLQHPAGYGRIAELVLLVVLEAKKPNNRWAISFLFIFVEIHHRHLVNIETLQPFRPAVGIVSVPSIV